MTIVPMPKVQRLPETEGLQWYKGDKLDTFVAYLKLNNGRCLKYEIKPYGDYQFTHRVFCNGTDIGLAEGLGNGRAKAWRHAKSRIAAAAEYENHPTLVDADVPKAKRRWTLVDVMIAMCFVLLCVMFLGIVVRVVRWAFA